MSEEKLIYFFGGGSSEGGAGQKQLLGGKGANLAEMASIGVPVPPGFTITTEACQKFYELGKQNLLEKIRPDVEKNLKQIEELTGKTFGQGPNPLLVSVRSGAAISMPGMMDTVLNLGLNDEAVEGLAKKTNNDRFAWDSYRRFIQMYGDVVMGLEPESKEDPDPFEEIIENLKEKKSELQQVEKRINNRTASWEGNAVIVAKQQKQFARYLGFEPVGILPRPSDMTARGLKELMDTAPVLIIGNLQSNADAARNLASRMDVPAVVLTNFPGAKGEALDYKTMLRENLSGLRQAWKNH